MGRFLEGDRDLCFVILSGARAAAAAVRSPAEATAQAAKQCAEKVAEITETVGAAAATTGIVKPEILVPRRRSEVLTMLPRRAEGIVPFSLVRVLQDRVRFVDLLELFLSPGILIDVRMLPARQLAKRLGDLLTTRVARDTENLVVILVGYTHVISPRWQCIQSPVDSSSSAGMSG